MYFCAIICPELSFSYVTDAYLRELELMLVRKHIPGFLRRSPDRSTCRLQVGYSRLATLEMSFMVFSLEDIRAQ